jgi:hypothetical protein
MPAPVRRARFTPHALDRLSERFDADPADVADLLIGHVPHRIHSGDRHYTVTHRGTITFVLAPPVPGSDLWTVLTVFEPDAAFDVRHREHSPHLLRERMCGTSAV